MEDIKEKSQDGICSVLSVFSQGLKGHIKVDFKLDCDMCGIIVRKP